ncbi:30S ribosomal protein S4 [Candidatus Parcubacteria bacterium]|nr:30S ribosomal protein S4 [Candidatus Parcubacteria bacterium]
MVKPKCKICRRLGVVLFEKCKKVLAKKPYPPGQKGKKRPRGLSEYGRELQEKQKLRNLYNLSEKQFKNYVKEVLEKKGRITDTSDFLIKKLEMRFDNVIYRMGFASSRAQARQLVSHGHFLINNKPVNIPSYQLKKGDKITARQKFLKSKFLQSIFSALKKYQAPSWLKLNYSQEKIQGEVIGVPCLEETAPPAEISAIFEYYSR